MVNFAAGIEQHHHKPQYTMKIKTPVSTGSLVATVAIAAAMALASCGGGGTEPAANNTAPKPAETTAPAAPAAPAAAAEPTPPPGFITAADITLGPIDQTMVANGQKIFDAKCKACHSLTDQKVVGPGWKGVTKERKPEWIMNMILHTDWMLENDTAAQNLVELTKARMTPQGLTKEEARDMLELMRTL
jgi:mono/diheme cytochrome c family protein